MAAYLSADVDAMYARNYPRKAARLADDCRARGDLPHSDSLHSALVALMFCANCGRPLNDPSSIDPGYRPGLRGNHRPRIADADQRQAGGRPADQHGASRLMRSPAEFAALSAADRRRLLERLAELADLDRIMRQPGTLANPGCCRDSAVR